MNRNGWGLRVELIFILLFLICLLIATIGLNKMGIFGGGNLFGRNSDNLSYTDLENKMNEAAKRYYENNYENITSDITIKSSTLLFNGYMSYLKDEKGKVCSGYTKVTTNYKGKLVFNTFINCPNYKTVGYTYE